MIPLLRSILLGLALLLASGAMADPAAMGPDLASLKSAFEYGKFEEVLTRSVEALNQPDLPEETQTELHQLAGLCAFNLGKTDQAKLHFGSVLKLEPDRALDPFSVPPPAISLFEEVRQELAPTLSAIRYERKLRAERMRAEALARAEKAQEEDRRQLLLLKDAPSARSLWLSFLPGGVPQYQQGRTGMGIGLSVSQGLFAVISVLGYVGYSQLIQERTVMLDNRQTADGTALVVERGIPREKYERAQVFKWMQLGGGAAFWGSYLFGVGDALWYEKKTSLSLTPSVSPVAGGARAQLSLTF